MDLTDWLHRLTGIGPEYQARVLSTLVVVAVLWLTRALVLRIVRRRTDNLRLQYRWRKATAYALASLGALVVLQIWFGGLSGVSTYVAVVSAGLAIALRDPLVNLAGWAFILWRRPFEVGDRIQLGEIAGDVIDQRIFQFTLMEIGNWVRADQSTGRVIHLPNGLVFAQPLANYTKGFQFIWDEIPVLVTFESDWQKAKRLLLEIAHRNGAQLADEAKEKVRKAAERFLIHYQKLTPTVYTSVADSGVLLTLRYLCRPRERRAAAEAIWEDILREFARHDDIDFAYPTERRFDNRTEGKPGARAE